MSYLVLARKWRPQTFEEVIGQPHVTKTLQNAIRSNRIAHAYLFTGARGVGKTSIARILAKTLNCERDISPAPCNVCSNCKEITQGNAVDVLEIDGASNRGIDNIRELRETVRYRPAKSRYKIYIIDEVHMLTTEAFNALLKTLEEPPEHVLFIFATTEPHKIPATILSRCQRFDFRRIAAQELVGHLKAIGSAEKAGLSEAVLYAIAREADGSMRDAQSLLEQVLAFSGDDLSDEEILDVLGVVDRSSVHRVGEAILAGDVGTCLGVVGDLYRRGIDSRRFCQQLCDHFRNLLFLSLGAEGSGSSNLDLPEEEKKILIREISRTTPETLYLYFQMILKGEEEIRRSSLPRISLEMLLLRLAQLPNLESLDGVLEKLSVLEKKLAGGPCREHQERSPAAERFGPTASPAADRMRDLSADVFESPPQKPLVVSEPEEPRQAAPPSQPVSHDQAEKRWPDFLIWLEGKDPILWAKLNGSRLTSVSDTDLELEVLDIYENVLNEPQALAKLTNAAEAFFGLKLKCAIRSRSSFQPEFEDSKKVKSAKINPKRLVLENPVVQQALEILGGELIDIRAVKS